MIDKSFHIGVVTVLNNEDQDRSSISGCFICVDPDMKLIQINCNKTENLERCYSVTAWFNNSSTPSIHVNFPSFSRNSDGNYN